jgi:kumamolisin
MEPQSPNYGNFLNATTLLPYLPTPGEKASISSFLTYAGFTITQGASPLVLQLSGTVAAAEDTFGVSLGYYQAAGQTFGSSFYAINTDPSLPTAYANLVTGIIGLDNYSTPRPVESPCSTPYCPQGIQVGYSFTNLYGIGDNGVGQTVAIVDAPGDPSIQTSINAFSTQYSLASITLTVLTPDGIPSSYDPVWASETAMDVEAVHTVAPGASITLLYGSSTSDDLVSLIDYVASHHLAKIVSNSWVEACLSGTCSDIQLSLPFVNSIDSRLATDVAQGLTILFASGDQGAKPDPKNNPTVFGTEFPASDPNVLAVGATNLVLTECGTSTCTGYGSETGASISGGGYSGHFAEPSWQTSTIGSTSAQCTTGHLHSDCRAVPDVSMLGLNPGLWVYSSSVKACVGGTLDGGGWFGCSGTSLSTPLWAGFLAIVLQLRSGVALGNMDPLLYQTANNPGLYSVDFHDITSGNNNGYNAGVGWDPVTGWGTPVASNLALTLASVTVTFNTVPATFPLSSTPGTITACSNNFHNGQSGPCPPTFNATANLPTPNAGWQFDHWSWTGGVSCASNATTTTACTFTSSGSLTATFRAQVIFTITSSLATIGWGTCAGSGQASGSMPYETNFGTVSACYVPIGYSVLSWVCSEGLSCAGSSDVTPVSFIAPGTITLNLQSGLISSPAQTNITATASNSTPVHGSMFNVTGRLRLVSTGAGIGSEPIECVFSWSTNIVTVTTNQTAGALGNYTCTVIAPTTPGPYNVDVFFLGDYTHGAPDYLPSKATAMITVT